jgi:hypothetical protein
MSGRYWISGDEVLGREIGRHATWLQFASSLDVASKKAGIEGLCAQDGSAQQFYAAEK